MLLRKGSGIFAHACLHRHLSPAGFGFALVNPALDSAFAPCRFIGPAGVALEGCFCHAFSFLNGSTKGSPPTSLYDDGFNASGNGGLLRTFRDSLAAG